MACRLQDNSSNILQWQLVIYLCVSLLHIIRSRLCQNSDMCTLILLYKVHGKHHAQISICSTFKQPWNLVNLHAKLPANWFIIASKWKNVMMKHRNTGGVPERAVGLVIWTRPVEDPGACFCSLHLTSGRFPVAFLMKWREVQQLSFHISHSICLSEWISSNLVRGQVKY